MRNESGLSITGFPLPDSNEVWHTGVIPMKTKYYRDLSNDGNGTKKSHFYFYNCTITETDYYQR